jgi:hypothetical protein
MTPLSRFPGHISRPTAEVAPGVCLRQTKINTLSALLPFICAQAYIVSMLQQAQTAKVYPHGYCCLKEAVGKAWSIADSTNSMCGRETAPRHLAQAVYPSVAEKRKKTRRMGQNRITRRSAATGFAPSSAGSLLSED